MKCRKTTVQKIKNKYFKNVFLWLQVGYGSLFLHHSSKPFGHSFDNHPIGVHHPISGHHNGFIGDIRGDKYYGDFHGFQQISSSKPSSIFRGVNYFPQDDQAMYKDVKRDKKEAK